MSERKNNPLDLAYQEIPPVWYEKLGRYFFHLNAISVMASSSLYNHYIDVVSVETALAGSALYLASTAADRLSTMKAMDAMEKAMSVGIEGRNAESNFLLKSVKTSRDLVRNPVGYALDALGLGFSALNPGVAVSFSTFRGIATLNNLRAARRYDKAVEIAKAA